MFLTRLNPRELEIVDDPGDQIAEKQLRQKIQECLETMPPKRRLVADMSWLKEMAGNEVAECLGIKPAAVSQHLKQARETLRCCLRIHGFTVPE